MFIQKEISDVTNQLLDSSLRLLMQLLVQWKTSMNSNFKVNTMTHDWIYSERVLMDCKLSMSLLRIFHTLGNVTTTGAEQQYLSLYLVLIAFEYGRIFIVPQDLGFCSLIQSSLLWYARDATDLEMSMELTCITCIAVDV
jgi:hypothetical protein